MSGVSLVGSHCSLLLCIFFSIHNRNFPNLPSPLTPPHPAGFDELWVKQDHHWLDETKGLVAAPLSSLGMAVPGLGTEAKPAAPSFRAGDWMCPQCGDRTVALSVTPPFWPGGGVQRQPVGVCRWPGYAQIPPTGQKIPQALVLWQPQLRQPQEV